MRLTEYSHGSGWACKLSQGELAQVLKQSKQKNSNNSEVLVGLENPDDGAVIDLGNSMKIVQTVDFFTPILDNLMTGVELPQQMHYLIFMQWEVHLFHLYS